ncbi:MAG: TAXI family TRAP transporter solute-binding subunit [Bacillota bacterium]|uniref:TAXI family TRAP transporter solute-binding subunit n=1 Tax=Thermanaerosceptrum fracticalcis TaxID=1712410 RepID=A0A7G6DZT1_THEFR|nr:TAXI family TRAP transporter solute-binding subunit [Thermanaerosceptrum fracticalcis]QNB45335.1 TAXI family TRAP transporter solute-binding subunit [Thermanaerosceptrum fracticalcis]
MKKIIALILVLSLILTLAVGCGSSSNGGKPAEPKKEPVYITIATGGSSGPYFALGGAVAKLFNEKIPGANASVQSTGASAVNATLLGEKKAELAFAMNDVVSYAYTGTEVFKDKGAVKNLRGLAALYPNYVQVVTLAKTGIKSIYDLKGKRVGVGAPGSGTEVNARQILEAHGITYKDIKPDYLSYAEAIEQMKNGAVDAAFLTSGLPNSNILDLCTTQDVKIVPIDPKAVEKLAEKYPFYTSVLIPGGTYDDKEDVPTAAVTTILVVREDMKEDLVYNMTKVIFENLDVLVSTHSAAKDIKLEKIKKGMPIPFHPGAEKYFKEKGIN